MTNTAVKTTTKPAATKTEAAKPKTEAQVLAILKRSKKGRTLNELGTTYYRLLRMQANGLVTPTGERETGKQGRPATEYGVTDLGRDYVAPKPKAKPAAATKSRPSKGKAVKGAKPTTKGKKVSTKKAVTTKRPTKAKTEAAKAIPKPDVATANVQGARASQVRTTKSLAEVNAAKAGLPIKPTETQLPGRVNA